MNNIQNGSFTPMIIWGGGGGGGCPETTFKEKLKVHKSALHVPSSWNIMLYKTVILQCFIKRCVKQPITNRHTNC